MKKAILLIVLVLGLCSLLFLPKVQASQITAETLEKMPLAFTKNVGQWDERVLFRANSGGATMWLTKEGVTYQFTRRIDRSGAVSAPGLANAIHPYNPTNRFSQERDSVEQMILTTKFVCANPSPEVIAQGQMEYKCNYFTGNEPSKWHTDVPSYETITLKDIYTGIDLKYSRDGTGQAAYEFIVAPGADIAQIKVTYEGAVETSIDSEGRLIMRTKWGDMIAAIKTPVNGVLSGITSFSGLSEKKVGFEANAASRQARGTLSVVLVYSTCLGGSGQDLGIKVKVVAASIMATLSIRVSPTLPRSNTERFLSCYQSV